MLKKIRLTKVNAVENQLETALKLYFQNEDIVSIHTLVSACMVLLKDLLHKRKRIITDFDETLFKKLPKEYQKELRNGLNKQQNFLKHADQDHYQAMEFNPNLTEIFLYTAINDFQKLTNNITPIQLTYRFWFQIQYKDKFPFSKEKLAELSKYVNLNRSNFFKQTIKDAYTIAGITNQSS